MARALRGCAFFAKRIIGPWSNRSPSWISFLQKTAAPLETVGIAPYRGSTVAPYFLSYRIQNYASFIETPVMSKSSGRGYGYTKPVQKNDGSRSREFLCKVWGRDINRQKSVLPPHQSIWSSERSCEIKISFYFADKPRCFHALFFGFGIIGI